MKKINFKNVIEWENFTKKNFITKLLHENKYFHLDNIVKKFDLANFNILDLGCGFCESFRVLNNKYNINYLGVENNEDITSRLYERYSDFKNFKVISKSALDIDDLKNKHFNFIILFDILEHIDLKNRINLIHKISQFKFDKILINVPNEVGLSILMKNFGSMIMGYERYKEYTMKETISSFLGKLEDLDPHFDQHKGFDWRVLKYILHYYFIIDNIHTNLRGLLPKSISPSIFFECSFRNLMHLKL